tara:strand:+ start:1351 stop:1749 length:399 start_codon:yes stop_codon:yes gene_type:complete
MSSLLQGNVDNNKIRVASVADPDTATPAGYHRGLAVDDTGAFLYSTTDTANASYVAGLRVSPKGVLIAATTGFDHFGPGAAPQSSIDALVVDLVNVASHFYQGVPYASNAIVVGAVVPVNNEMNNDFNEDFG